MRESPGQGPSQTGGASVEDVRRALASLSEADLAKLDAYAANRIRRIGISASGRDEVHLFMEAMTSLLEERRHWDPARMDIVGCLTAAMWSISCNWARRSKTGFLEISEADLDRSLKADGSAKTLEEIGRSKMPDPEAALLAGELQTEEELVEEIKSLLKDNYIASLVIDGWAAGMKGPEIIEALNIETNQYRAAERLIRRRIDKRWPKGMPHVR